MKKPTRFERTQDELTSVLRSLRLVVREVGNNYIAGLQAEVARLEQAIRLAREDDVPDRKQLNQMLLMLRWLSKLDVKPQKGRKRDLKELDKLISKLGDMVETW
jgi:hypothetical protein